MKVELQRSLPADRRFLVVGDHYPLPLPRAIMANAMTITFLLLAGFGLLGHRLEFLPPSVRMFLVSNGSTMTGIAFFIFILSGSVRQTGAFEVYVNDRLVFSKLTEGRAPTVPELHRLIVDAAQLYQGK